MVYEPRVHRDQEVVRGVAGRRSDRSQAVLQFSRTSGMFKTGEEAYEYRRGTWAERQAREAREAQERQRAGEGVTRPLSRVPEIDR